MSINRSEIPTFFNHLLLARKQKSSPIKLSSVIILVVNSAAPPSTVASTLRDWVVKLSAPRRCCSAKPSKRSAPLRMRLISLLMHSKQ